MVKYRSAQAGNSASMNKRQTTFVEARTLTKGEA
jgi:hypothetical protein